MSSRSARARSSGPWPCPHRWTPSALRPLFATGCSRCACLSCSRSGLPSTCPRASRAVATNPPQPEQQPKVPAILPVMPSGGEVVFPFMVFPLMLSGERWGKLIDEVATGQKMLCLVALRQPDQQKEQIERGDVYDVGTAVLLARMIRMPDGNIQALLQGV